MYKKRVIIIMNIREISGEEFNNFAKKHMLKNFYQTKEYGDLMSHSDFSVMYIGGFQNNIILCASLIMYKNIGPNMKYGYAPRGFLIDYYNIELLEKFTRKIKEYFFKKGFAFIKINPEITYSKIDFENKSKSINPNSKELINKLKELGYDKLKDNLYFESLLPKYTPVIYLQEYNFDNLIWHWCHTKVWFDLSMSFWKHLCNLFILYRRRNHTIISVFPVCRSCQFSISCELQ